MKHILLSALVVSAGVAHGQLFTDDFESYAVGDGISAAAGAPWALWTAGATDQEAFISNDVAQSGTNSLKLESASPAGGPQDIMLIAGLGNGSYEVTFSLFVPEGSSGYYNVQENQIQGTDWAFETILYGDGNITYAVDGAVLLASTYATNSWLTITHYIDTESDLMHVYLNGEFLGQVPYDGLEVGGVNFYAAGDQINLPLYYVDDVIVAVADPVVDNVVSVTALECTFGPNPAQDNIRIQANFDQALVRILGLDGKVVLEERRNDLMAGAQLEFDLQNGMYLVEISNGTQRSTQRLVVRK